MFHHQVSIPGGPDDEFGAGECIVPAQAAHRRHARGLLMATDASQLTRKQGWVDRTHEIPVRGAGLRTIGWRLSP